nr:MAG TPA: hypothetical protein [Caudoviricetes sp.]DAI49121.1 MAG TPA: hypothetical protein [Bacteriophage sp.]
MYPVLSSSFFAIIFSPLKNHLRHLHLSEMRVIFRKVGIGIK